MKRLRRIAVMATVGLLFAVLLPSAPAGAFVGCRSFVGPLGYGIGTGPEYGACVSAVADAGLVDTFAAVSVGATPTGAGQPAYIWVSDSVCAGTGAWCVFAGAGVTKSGLSVGPYVYVCYIDQLANGFCVPDFDPAVLGQLLGDIDLPPTQVGEVLRATESLDLRAIAF